ncbi:TerB family tellurite resistance protein [Rhodobacter capsulatus]|uniref:TerB family tellurite resistance protein n=1 Tax=Rhodobacter capsulatus TaxID=1061 RepID=A0A4U1JP16_RHOCA|nr:TerB family tellurite resistance protein [Rhodobacter capsulatus]TKD17700.1 TerB family tellurite resistance protein [Rhodobacter capsulatus]
MFKFLTGLLADPHPKPLTADDADLALAALLVRLARSDERYDEDERFHIDQVLAARSGLSQAEAAALRARAEAAEAEAPDTVRFTRALKDKIAYEDRIGVIEALWQVALADDARTPEEDALIRLAARLLGVSDRDSGLARQRVAAGQR